MKRTTLTYGLAALVVAVLSVSFSVVAQNAASSPSPWSYHGPSGPDHWQHLSKDYAACGQHEQSPVDLAGAIPARLGAMRLDWHAVPIHVVRNGHAVEAEASDPGAVNSLALDNEVFRMVQFHLHQPSEHRIDGRRFRLEVHFVHRGTSGALTVLAVLLEEGPANPALQQVIDHAPIDDETDRVMIDPRQLLPARRAYFRYGGSLTTPPCSETVNWLIMVKPITASARQIAAVAAVYGNNARLLQTLGRRFLLVSQ